MLKLAKTYDKCGTDEPELTAVFLHGIASSSKSFEGLFDYFQNHNDEIKNIRLVAFDLLGAGKSYASDELEYDYKEQLEALFNAISELNINGPLVLVGHSMGTLIAIRFASLHPELVSGLILISAPIYRKEDIENPMFKKAMDGFRSVVATKSKELIKSKVFDNEMKNIVSDVENYEYLLRLSKPTIIIYGELDTIIASFNIPAVLKSNKNVSAVKTGGAHGVGKDKYGEIVVALKKLAKEEKIGGGFLTF